MMNIWEWQCNGATHWPPPGGPQLISLHSGSLPVHWLRHHYHDWDDYDIHISVKNVLMDLISLVIKMIFPPILSTCPCVFSYDHVSVPELVINDQVMVVLRAIVKIMMILSSVFSQ